MKKLVSIFLILLLFGACKTNKTIDRGISVKWELKGNGINANNEAEWLLTLTNSSGIELPSQGWTLYYNVLQKQHISPNFPFVAERANGDLRCIKPTKTFNGLNKGDSISFTLLSSGPVINISDRPLGFFIVYDDEPNNAYACKTTYVPLPVTELKRNDYDILPVHTPEITFAENKGISLLNKAEICPIIPTPASYYLKTDTLVLNDIISLSGDFAKAANFLKDKLSIYYRGEVKINDNNEIICFKKSPDIKNTEGYGLYVNTTGIEITASTEAGAFYAVQSLLQLLPNKAYVNPQNTIEIPCVEIIDEPRFKFRGQHLDVARNFHSKQQVLKLLDLLAFYKLNKFHFHICDDEGWRVEIKDLPELTEYGAFRGYSKNENLYLQPAFASGPSTASHGSGYYTRKDFIDILKYATERHIEVIPEIDMPGHARAAIKSMEKRYGKYLAQGDTAKATEYLLTDFNDKSEYKSVQGWNDNVVNVGMESTYNFLAKITDEMIAMFAEAGAPLTTIHTGGDEVPHGVWEKSPECNKIIETYSEYQSGKDLALYFIKRFSGLLADRGLIAAGWEEIALLHGEKLKPNPDMVGKNLQPTVWNNVWNWGSEDVGYKLANAGYPVVLAHVTNLYFDLAYYKHPDEFGYYWGSFINTRRPWEYTPFDITKSADTDHFGHAIDVQKFANEMEKLTPKGKANILGIQGLLWSETSLGPDRNDYQIFPKLLGLAERAWSPQPDWAINNDKNVRENQWNYFVNTVGQYHLPKLDYLHGGIHYRIPTVGVQIVDELLYANVIFPGLDIRYTTDGSDPELTSSLYTQPVKVNGKIKLRAFSSSGRGGRVVVVIN